MIFNVNSELNSDELVTHESDLFYFVVRLVKYGDLFDRKRNGVTLTLNRKCSW